MQHVAKEGSDYNPEIDRVQLRGIFLDVLGDHVKWGSHIKSVVPNPEGSGYQVTLGEGTSEVFDLVVGADGCFSRVRPLLNDTTPTYSGVTFIETYISDAANKHPALYEIVGRGMCMVPPVTANGKGFIGQQNSDGKMRIYAVLVVPEDWTKTNGYPWEKDCATTRKMLLENYPSSVGWRDDMLDLFRASDDTFRPWPIYTLPVGFKWDHKPGVTLIGDAAHVMSPFAGEGANISMLDGAKLGKAIADAVSAGGDLEEAIKQSEEDMFERAKVSAEVSHKNLLQATGLGGPLDEEAARKKWKEELEDRFEGKE